MVAIASSITGQDSYGVRIRPLQTQRTSCVGGIGCLRDHRSLDHRRSCRGPCERSLALPEPVRAYRPRKARDGFPHPDDDERVETGVEDPDPDSEALYSYLVGEEDARHVDEGSDCVLEHLGVVPVEFHGIIECSASDNKRHGFVVHSIPARAGRGAIPPPMAAGAFYGTTPRKQSTNPQKY